MDTKLLYLYLFFIGLPTILIAKRSVHRPQDPHMPEIVIHWTHEPKGKKHSLKSYYLEEWAIFGRFNKNYLLNYQLPDKIFYRYEPEKEVPRETLTRLTENFIQELTITKHKGNFFTDFTVLKDRDFNYKTQSGIIVIKFKAYPFVVKLFMENPKTFTRPFSKGIEPSFFFVMGGGINRYLTGFTRIPNLHAINEKIAKDPYWSKRLTTPRKWFWIPEDSQWFTITGKNIGGKATQSMDFPGTYAIICDAIQFERELSITSKHDRTTAMKLARFIGNRIDPHICNFMIEKDTGLIAFIDTEHFASIVGLREDLYFNHYTSWYTRLANKFFKDSMLRTKRNQRAIQKKPTPKILVL